MKIINYSKEYKDQWDAFVKKAKNSHFFFQREYMEYHADRFADYSLLVLDHKEKIISILPANKKENNLYSHQGITFGSFIVNDKMKTETMLEIFDILKDFLKEARIERLIYKCIPYIYHIKPSEEDRYALFINDATLIRRDVSSTIDLTEQVRYSKGRKWSVKKSQKEGVTFQESLDFSSFWILLNDVLNQKHDTHAVHSLEEMKLLHSRFPQNIRLFLAYRNGELLAGSVVYETQTVAHTQYLANSNLGREIGALDGLIDFLIKETFKHKKYFDFGISTESQGQELNTGLISQKEGYGARAIVHDFYELKFS
jgi:hypothetical protein